MRIVYFAERLQFLSQNNIIKNMNKHRRQGKANTLTNKPQNDNLQFSAMNANDKWLTSYKDTRNNTNIERS